MPCPDVRVPFQGVEGPIMMGKHPYKVWVDHSGYWSAFSRCVIPLLGVGVPSKDVAVSCEDVGVPFKNV